ncbi:replication initiation protein [Paraclostridium bifermentans]|uniref:replication initiation protein n=1 Tax=Paraclostridium bifermentans TaxID=1490 RepID=UPI00387ACD1E
MTKKEILMQPNNLIKSKYNFSNIENKLFYKLLFNAQKNRNNGLYETIITMDELKFFMKNNNDHVHSGVKEMLNLFQQSILEFEYIDDTLGRKLLFSSGLVTSYFYDEENKEYIIQIHEVLYKHITDFVRMQQEGLGYTALNLSVLFNFRGAYSQRMYTFLRMWSRQNKEVEVQYSIDDLRNYLKISQDIYPAYKNFKQKVIKKSIEEINEKGNMKVEIKNEIKKGRKIDQIVFSVIDYEPRKYFDKNALKEVIESRENENNKGLEVLSDGKYINTQEKEKETLKIENKEFCVPDETVFTKGTLRSFKMDFANTDFKDTYMKSAFDDAVMITLDRDDVETIKATSYKFFKGTLDNKIIEYEKEKEEEIKHKEEMDLFW